MIQNTRSEICYLLTDSNHNNRGKLENQRRETSEIRNITCIVCPIGCNLIVHLADGQISKISKTGGNKCRKGMDYAIKEIFDPTRVLTTTIKIKGANLPLLPVKTDAPIPKEMLRECMKVINNIEISAPVRLGEIIIKNILDSGVNVIATRSANQHMF